MINDFSFFVKRTAEFFFSNYFIVNKVFFFTADTPLLCGIREAPVVYIKGHKFQLELHEPEEKYQEIARNELRESPERTKAAVEELRTLLKGIANNHRQIKHNCHKITYLPNAKSSQ